jgi:hypothetical protein
MNARTQITIDPKIQKRARAKAARLGISFAEYVRRLVTSDLGLPRKKGDISILFDLVDEGLPTDIVRGIDIMLGQAVWKEFKRNPGGKPRASKSRDTPARFC